MSKASYELLTPSKRESFLIRKFDRNGFLAPFHFHPEYEITFILEGSGKRFVGSNMSGYEKDDLVLIGSNLPHCWKLDSKNVKASSLVIQFSHEFLGAGFFNLPEMETILKLLNKSAGGIHFYGKIKWQVKDIMAKLYSEKNNFTKLMLLFSILKILSNSKNYDLLNKKSAITFSVGPDSEKINKVYAYIVENFREAVTLNEASAILNMTPNAFCKYYKKITRKTFMETVIDFRINYATQQLIDNDKSVADACYESGFRDMSHFYKKFTERMALSPLNYKKQFLQEMRD